MTVYQKDLNIKSDLWKHFGFTLKYVGDGKAGSKLKDPLNGLFDKNLALTTAMNSGASALAGAVKDVINQSTDSLLNTFSEFMGDYFGNKGFMGKMFGGGIKIAGAGAKDSKNMFMQGQSINETIQVWQSSSCGLNFTIDTYFIPGLFGFKSYKYLEEFAAYATLGSAPKIGSLEAIGFLPMQPNVYNPKQAYKGPFIDLDKNLFALEIKNLISIPGGLYIKNFTRDYSVEKDKDGVPIFCKATIELEYYREVTADEYMKFIKVK